MLVSGPAVVVLAGLPGAGKTTVAYELRDAFGFHVLSRDVVKRALFGLDDVGAPQNDVAFAAMLQALPALLAAGRPVVVDGMPFGREGQAEAVRDAVGASCPFVVVLVDTPTHVARARLAVPDPDGPSDRTPALVDEVAARFRPVPADWVRVDGRAGPAATAAAVVAHVQGA